MRIKLALRSIPSDYGEVGLELSTDCLELVKALGRCERGGCEAVVWEARERGMWTAFVRGETLARGALELDTEGGAA